MRAWILRLWLIDKKYKSQLTNSIIYMLSNGFTVLWKVYVGKSVKNLNILRTLINIDEGQFKYYVIPLEGGGGHLMIKFY